MLRIFFVKKRLFFFCIFQIGTPQTSICEKYVLRIIGLDLQIFKQLRMMMMVMVSLFIFLVHLLLLFLLRYWLNLQLNIQHCIASQQRIQPIKITIIALFVLSVRTVMSSAKKYSTKIIFHLTTATIFILLTLGYKKTNCS